MKKQDFREVLLFPDAVSLHKTLHSSRKMRKCAAKNCQKVINFNTEQMQKNPNMITEKVQLHFMLAFLIAMVLCLFEDEIITETFSY